MKSNLLIYIPSVRCLYFEQDPLECLQHLMMFDNKETLLRIFEPYIPDVHLLRNCIVSQVETADFFTKIPNTHNSNICLHYYNHCSPHRSVAETQCVRKVAVNLRKMPEEMSTSVFTGLSSFNFIYNFLLLCMFKFFNVCSGLCSVY
jgi:hypothetical protein